MKCSITFVAVRTIEVGEPEEGQSIEDFLQKVKETTVDDPFSFIDVPHEQIDVACSVLGVK